MACTAPSGCTKNASFRVGGSHRICGTSVPRLTRAFGGPGETTFPGRLVRYSTFSQIVSERQERLPRLIMIGTEIANGTIENAIRSLSRLVPGIPTVVLAPNDDVDLARKVISLGAKAYIPVPTRCEVVAVIRFILTSAA